MKNDRKNRQIVKNRQSTPSSRHSVRKLGLESLERREVMNADLTFLGDLNTTRDFGAVESYAKPIPQIGKVGLVALPDKDRGTELWRSDGTVDGTYLLKDIAPNEASSNPSNLTVVNGDVYFTATGESLVEGIWKTDGTRQGTRSVFIPQFGYTGNNIRQLTPTSDGLFFLSPSNNSEVELLTIRSSSNEVVVVDAEAAIFRNPYSLLSINGYIIVRANDAITQEPGLYSVDSDSLAVQKLGAVDFASVIESTTDRLYWIALDESSQQRVWISDGTLQGTSMVQAINGTNTTYLSSLGVLDNSLILSRFNPESETKEVLALSNTGTVNVLASTANANAVITLSVALGGKAILAEEDTKGSVWLTDGTPSGTTLTTGLAMGTALDASRALEWKGNWVISGWTDQGTHAWYLLNRNSAVLTPIAALNDASESGQIEAVSATTEGFYWYEPRTRELQFTGDGLQTRKLRDSMGLFGAVATINATDLAVMADDNGLVLASLQATGTSNLSNPFDLNTLGSTRNIKPVVRDGIAFTLGIDGQGTRLWKTDGTDEGTRLVSDNIFQSIKVFRNMDSSLLLIDQIDDSRTQYWAMNEDGSLRLVMELDMLFDQFQVVGDSIYASNGNGLWYMANPETKPVLLQSSAEIGLIFQLAGSVSQLDRLYFLALSADDNATSSVWTSDGTAIGTLPVQGGRDVGFDQAVILGSTIYYSNLGSLYRTTDGFATQTKLTEKMSLSNLQVVAGSTYFTSTLDNFQIGFWRIDGEELVLVTSFNPSGEYSQAPGMLEVDRRPYFFGNDPLTGQFVLLTESELSQSLVAVPQAQAFGSGFAWQLLSLGEKLVGPKFDLAVGEELFATDLKATASDDQFSVKANESMEGSVVSNDFLGPKGGASVRVELLGLPKNGQVTVGKNGLVKYVPSSDFVGTDEWSYRFINEFGETSNVASVFVRVDSVYYNEDAPLDVDGDGRVTPLDPLKVINFLNSEGSQKLLQSIELVSETGWIDTNGDGNASPLDVLRVINALNRTRSPSPGEGESRGAATDSWMASFSSDSLYDDESPKTRSTTKRSRRIS
jgi:ELWxxDGT repeat protein